ncbi:MAG: hypothetical protein Q4B64_01080 [Spirochaetales bacterium]|nr:hypothetical protein [Spirochaetales bacterium]
MKTIRKHLLVILGVIVIGVFSSCDGEVEMELYTSDLIEAMNTKEPLYAKVSLIIEGMTENYDYEFLRNYIPSFTNPHYVKYDYQTSLAFDIKVPIVNNKEFENLDQTGQLFVIVGAKTTSGYSYSISINRELIRNISSYTSSTMYQSFNLEDFDFCYKLANDLRDAQEYKIFSSYMNTIPYPMSHTFSLERRDSQKIKMSEIYAKSLNQDETYYFLTITQK